MSVKSWFCNFVVANRYLTKQYLQLDKLKARGNPYEHNRGAAKTRCSPSSSIMFIFIDSELTPNLHDLNMKNNNNNVLFSSESLLFQNVRRHRRRVVVVVVFVVVVVIAAQTCKIQQCSALDRTYAVIRIVTIFDCQ